jgi:iron complex outermembrane receptor protein
MPELQSAPRTARTHLAQAALLFSVGVANAIAQSPSMADVPPLEEIIVTAELLPTRWLEQTASSSIVSAAAMESRAAVHLENLLLLAPNVNLAGGTSRARFYQIRGVGERSQFVEPLNPSVGLLIDNIDFSGLGTAAGLYDIEQVEVLRGPQGTLHGANALAGLISMRSAAPTETFEARVNAGIGDYNRRDLGATVSGPLVAGKLLGRLAAFQHRSDGFMRNSYLGRSDTNARDETMLRGKLRWHPNTAQRVDLTLLRADMDNGYDAFSLDNTRATLSDQPGRDRQTSTALGLHWQYQGRVVTSELLASYADTDSEYSYDEDWSFPGIAPDLEYASFDRYLRERRSHSLQLRFSSTEALAVGGRDLRWVGGLYRLEDDEALRRQYTYLSTDFESRFEASTTAIYGQLDLDLSDSWLLSGGLRLADRRMRYADSNAAQSSVDNSLWGGKLALSYDTQRWGHFYTALSRGYRAGGVNAGILAFPRDSIADSASLDELSFFDEELLYNLEIGHKGRFANGRLTSALTLFLMHRSDQQVRGSIVIPRQDGSTAFVDFTDNAASGENMGIEWELRSRMSERLDGYLNIGLLRARFDEYLNADGLDLADREQAHAPSYQFALGASYQISEALNAELEWEGRDSFYFSDRHDAQAPAFQLLHLRLGWQHGGFSASLWARNVLNEDYFVRGFGSFGNDPRKGYVTEEYRQFGEPRQVGLSVAVQL